MYQALHYVLLFPTGQLGWYPDLELNLPLQENAPLANPEEGDPGRVQAVRRRRKHVSLVEYFAYRLHICPNEQNHLFKAGRLFQEYIVDSWASAEQYCLRWFRNNQDTI
jgi:hypothetical protein